MRPYTEKELKISFERLLSLGQLEPYGDFNMAYLAIRGSGFVNGVSRLHGVVSRRLFRGLFPRFPEEEVPVGFITNGVHVPTWASFSAEALWTEACGNEPWFGKTEEMHTKIRSLPDRQIWEMRNRSRAGLIEYARSRLVRYFAARGVDPNWVEIVKSILNPNVLTLGFARRFATYKRPDLLLADEERLLRILNHKERPVQLIIAGKAHPADSGGHALIHKWMQFISRPEARSSVVFLSDYDMILTAHMVRGVDLWINTPRRPWEASGTSGMKVLVNGGLNLSELDGWWAEAYTPEVGWAIGDREEHGEDPGWDWAEANALYELLEKEIIPEFYTRDARGFPVNWTVKIRESMARLTPYFSSNRAVREYTEKFYLPAAENYVKRAKNNGHMGKEILKWRQNIEKNWGRLRFGSVKVEEKNGQRQFEVEVYLADLDPKALKVDLYSAALTQEMQYEGRISGKPGWALVSSRGPACGAPFGFYGQDRPSFSWSGRSSRIDLYFVAAMNISPLAGKLPPPELLIDASKLIQAYYKGVPDPSVPAQRVEFGTSGHRGSSLSASFNEHHILAITQAICLYRNQYHIDGPLFLGMDTHALSMPAFKTALEVLAANGVAVMVSEGDEYTPTPVISHAILVYNRGRKTGCADGIVVTPSHNPPDQGGF